MEESRISKIIGMVEEQVYLRTGEVWHGIDFWGRKSMLCKC